MTAEIPTAISPHEYALWIEAQRIKSDAFFELVEARQRAERNALIERRRRIMEAARIVARQLAKN